MFRILVQDPVDVEHGFGASLGAEDQEADRAVIESEVEDRVVELPRHRERPIGGPDPLNLLLGLRLSSLRSTYQDLRPGAFRCRWSLEREGTRARCLNKWHPIVPARCRLRGRVDSSRRPGLLPVRLRPPRTCCAAQSHPPASSRRPASLDSLDEGREHVRAVATYHPLVHQRVRPPVPGSTARRGASGRATAALPSSTRRNLVCGESELVAASRGDSVESRQSTSGRSRC